MSQHNSQFPVSRSGLNYALSSEPLLLNGMKVLFDQSASVYPVSLETKGNFKNQSTLALHHGQQQDHYASPFMMKTGKPLPKGAVPLPGMVSSPGSGAPQMPSSPAAAPLIPEGARERSTAVSRPGQATPIDKISPLHFLKKAQATPSNILTEAEKNIFLNEHKEFLEKNSVFLGEKPDFLIFLSEAWKYKIFFAGDISDSLTEQAKLEFDEEEALDEKEAKDSKVGDIKLPSLSTEAQSAALYERLKDFIINSSSPVGYVKNIADITNAMNRLREVYALHATPRIESYIVTSEGSSEEKTIAEGEQIIERHEELLGNIKKWYQEAIIQKKELGQGPKTVLAIKYGEIGLSAVPSLDTTGVSGIASTIVKGSVSIYKTLKHRSNLKYLKSKTEDPDWKKIIDFVIAQKSMKAGQKGFILGTAIVPYASTVISTSISAYNRSTLPDRQQYADLLIKQFILGDLFAGLIIQELVGNERLRAVVTDESCKGILVAKMSAG